MQRHNKCLDDIIDRMSQLDTTYIQKGIKTEHTDPTILYSDFLNEGFDDTEIFVSYNEFCDCEYKEQDYIKELCDICGDGNELYANYLKDIKIH